MFKGTIKRVVGDKQNLSLPSDWGYTPVDITNKIRYVLFNKDDVDIFVYPLEYWLDLFKKSNNKSDFASCSVHVVLNNEHQLILPEYIHYKNVIIVGMEDYFVIRESDV